MDQEHYYVLSHSGQKVGSTIKEARNTLKLGGSAIKALFELGVIKRINENETNVGNYGTNERKK